MVPGCVNWRVHSRLRLNTDHRSLITRLRRAYGGEAADEADVIFKQMKTKRTKTAFRILSKHGLCLLSSVKKEKRFGMLGGSALPIRLIRAIRGYFSFGASEATIFSKRGSPRSGSQNGFNFRSP
jgi:hypothetical protein